MLKLLFVGLSVSLASTSFFSTPQLLKEMFATSERVDFVELTAADTAGIDVTGRQFVYVAKTGNHVDGFAVVGDERGQHEPITFGIAVGEDGRITRVEVMAYREARGDGIRDRRFLRQFVGKTLDDPMKVGVDVDGVTGATLSSRSTTVMARRALALCKVAARKIAPSTPSGVVSGAAAVGGPAAVLGTR